MPVYVREIERSQDGRHAGELAKALRQKIMPHVALSRVSISRQGNNLHIDVSFIVSEILVAATRREYLVCARHFQYRCSSD